MNGSALTTLTVNPAPSLQTSMLSSTVSTAAASATRLAWTSNFSSIVRRQSSKVRSSSFCNFFFTQK